MKPTHGLIPYTGVCLLESTIDTLGPMTKVGDASGTGICIQAHSVRLRASSIMRCCSLPLLEATA